METLIKTSEYDLKRKCLKLLFWMFETILQQARNVGFILFRLHNSVFNPLKYHINDREKRAAY